MAADFGRRLADRAAREGLVLVEALADNLLLYLDVLYRWNRTINLTGLTDPDEAIDRLLLEPVAAAAHLPHHARMADLGSGGGSPAIPLALALEASNLLMVEARSRKAAFLREAVRELGLTATVESLRFENVATWPKYQRTFDLVTMRAIRPDDGALTAAATLVGARGVVAIFRGPDGPDRVDGSAANLTWRETRPLLRSTGSRLTVFNGRETKRHVSKSDLDV